MSQINTINRIVNEHLKSFNVSLSYKDRDAVVPESMRLRDPREATNVMNTLHTLGFLSTDDRARLGPSLVRMEQSLEYINQRRETITDPQKQIITFFIEPYLNDLDDLVREQDTTDQKVDIIKNWIERVACGIKYSRHSKIAVRIMEGQTVECMDAIDLIAKVYISFANLEKTLLQVGPHLPSESMIRDTILTSIRDLFSSKIT